MAVVKKYEKLFTEVEVAALYPKEWVAVEVVSVDRRNQWTKGRLVAHSPDHEKLAEAYREFRQEHPKSRIASFYTGPVELDQYAIVL